MYPACWSLQSCTLSPPPTPSTNQRRSTHFPVHFHIFAVEKNKFQISQLNLNLIIFRVEREAKEGGKMETLSKELDHRIRLSHLSKIVNIICL